MFIVVAQEGCGINLANFHLWDISQDEDNFEIYCWVVVNRTDQEEAKITYSHLLGKYKSEKRAKAVLKILNDTIIAGQIGYRMPEE